MNFFLIFFIEFLGFLSDKWCFSISGTDDGLELCILNEITFVFTQSIETRVNILHLNFSTLRREGSLNKFILRRTAFRMLNWEEDILKILNVGSNLKKFRRILINLLVKFFLRLLHYGFCTLAKPKILIFLIILITNPIKAKFDLNPNGNVKKFNQTSKWTNKGEHFPIENPSISQVNEPNNDR